ncbi:MAG: NAD(P)/FAD-dependent oxidoreductase [bacterium]|nr:NAD(P)/FAD-dependent oxidoreductase [bacterium]
MKTDILVIGGGPAGLSAAITAKSLGTDVIVVDENPKIGGQLIKQTHKFFGSKQHWCGVRGIDIATILMRLVEESGIKVFPNASAIGIYNENGKKIVGVVLNNALVPIEADGIIVATGAQENMLNFVNNDLPGVYGAGAVQTLVNVYGVPPGERVLMIGSGNIGLIVSYQLMQAGIQVIGIVEAMPYIGGYLVHASKVRRLGIPIYTSHTIKEAIGTDEVVGAVIVELDSDWNEIAGTEKRLDCDVICLAVGLTPSAELLWQAGCDMVYISELGGYVPWHNKELQTSIHRIYVAGDTSGIEEAVTAILEGRIAGAACAYEIAGVKEAKEIIKQNLHELREFRKGPFGEKARVEKEKLKMTKSECQMTNLL